MENLNLFELKEKILKNEELLNTNNRKEILKPLIPHLTFLADVIEKYPYLMDEFDIEMFEGTSLAILLRNRQIYNKIKNKIDIKKLHDNNIGYILKKINNEIGNLEILELFNENEIYDFSPQTLSELLTSINLQNMHIVGEKVSINKLLKKINTDKDASLFLLLNNEMFINLIDFNIFQSSELFQLFRKYPNLLYIKKYKTELKKIKYDHLIDLISITGHKNLIKSIKFYIRKKRCC